MAEHGASLQLKTKELVTCIEDLKDRRYKLQQIIDTMEEEKATLEKNLKTIQEKLSGTKTKLNNCYQTRNTYNHTINQLEMGFEKICESSQALLSLGSAQLNRLGSLEEPLQQD